MLPRISHLILSSIMSHTLIVAVYLHCHVKESIRSQWIVSNFQACLPSLGMAEPVMMLPFFCASIPLPLSVDLFCCSWQISLFLGHKEEGKEPQGSFLSFLRNRPLHSSACFAGLPSKGLKCTSFLFPAHQLAKPFLFFVSIRFKLFTESWTASTEKKKKKK